MVDKKNYPRPTKRETPPPSSAKDLIGLVAEKHGLTRERAAELIEAFGG